MGIIPAGAGKSGKRSARRHRQQDHPRGCGEKQCRAVRGRRSPGSSPRVRGKDYSHELRWVPEGIIPAGAGKSNAGLSEEGGRQDHPRGCGEKYSTTAPSVVSAGSSPRVRGKVGGGLRHMPATRIIPAGAGKSAPRRAAEPDPADHPRGCFAGIIPAGAGKSAPGRKGRQALEDHPRGCGEKGGHVRPAPPEEGSSPRVRGKDAKSGKFICNGGIIPAGAGKSCAKQRGIPQLRDHPRGCGEKLALVFLTFCSMGSSPRVRGKAGGGLVLHHRAGIIPAGAGKSRQGGSKRAPAGDHPRGCGEKAEPSPDRNARQGSSPRVRGKAFAFLPSPPQRGIIPAGAGKSRRR